MSDDEIRLECVKLAAQSPFWQDNLIDGAAMIYNFVRGIEPRGDSKQRAVNPVERAA